MSILSTLYRPSLALLTDLYQLTMAYGYWKAAGCPQSGSADREAVFHVTFRHSPFKGGFTIAAGLATVVDYLEQARFSKEDAAYLATLKGNDGRALFETAYLDYLCQMEPAWDIDAVPEGTVVFPHEPLVRVRGPLMQGQLLETALLNIVNFQTLIATKAARLVLAAQGDPVLEFGLRRAQGIDGALSASRAAYIGGCSATSNVLAGQLFGIPVGGTHAHSWVMCHDNELTAFREYARVLPNNCVFLVDTYDTLQGVRHAVIVGQELRRQGHEMIGVRLDSGDLASLSIEARQILDEGGFPKASIVASNDLDERIVETLKQQGAKVSVWGVGTRLVTGSDEPALGGVYKLSAIRRAGEPWHYKVKLSEQTVKVSTPGVLQVRRWFADGTRRPLVDAIYDESVPSDGQMTIVDTLDMTRRQMMPEGSAHEDLLVPVFRGGKKVYESPDLATIRQRAAEQIASFPSGVKRFANPHEYFVGLERGLHERKTRLILQERGFERYCG
jgi:nicotinate phosphoribosyltransferase